MPESPLPPIWGLGYDERDLDALLSGEAWRPPGQAHGIPEPLRPVAGTLAALRAAPAGGELSGEAAARAAFRAFPPAAPRSPGPGAWPWAVAAGHEAVTSRTLVFPLGEGGRRPTRHRRLRGAPAGRWPVAVATGAAAMAVLVIAVALAGLLPGSVRQIANLGRHPAGASAPVRGSARPSATQRVDGGGSRVRSPRRSPSARPAPAASGAAHATQSPAGLCREYYTFLAHRDPAAKALGAELSVLAGGPLKIFGYCFAQLDYLPRGKEPGTVPTPVPGSGSGSGFGSGGVGATQDPNPGSGDQGRHPRRS